MEAVLETVGWIPEKYSVVNKAVKILKDDETWDDGWIVKEVFAKVEECNLPDSHKEIKAHKKRTGDSMPKD